MVYTGGMTTTQNQTIHLDAFAFCDGCDEFLPTAELVTNDDNLLVCEMCK